MPIYFHPQRGAVVTDKPLNRLWRRMRGGPNDAWQVLSEPLPQGFVRGDPEKQRFGMGGPELVFGPLERTCRECKRTFTWPAVAQKRLLEDGGAWIDAVQVRCLACTKRRGALARAKRAYDDALVACDEAPAAKTFLAAANAALALLHAGGKAPIPKALALARKAQRAGAKDADALVKRLRALLPRSASTTN